MWESFSFCLDYFERFFFSNQLWRLPLQNRLQLEWFLSLSICQEGSPFLLQTTGPRCKPHHLFCKRTSCGLPTVPHSVDGPFTSLMNLGMRKSKKASIPNGNSGQGLPGRASLLPWVPNWILSFMGIESARQQGSCHLLTSLGCQVLLVLPPKCLSNLSLLSQHQDPNLAQVLSHLEHWGSLPLVSSISPPICPLFWPAWSSLALPFPCCKPSVVAVTPQSIVQTLSSSSRALPAGRHSWDVHSTHAFVYWMG